MTSGTFLYFYTPPLPTGDSAATTSANSSRAATDDGSHQLPFSVHRPAPLLHLSHSLGADAYWKIVPSAVFAIQRSLADVEHDAAGSRNAVA